MPKSKINVLGETYIKFVKKSGSYNQLGLDGSFFFLNYELRYIINNYYIFEKILYINCYNYI